ncbi:hypothetical protein CGH51_25200, partial [Vibrio parahaemolyticus]
CFDQMWGECSSWKAIPNDANKVNEFHDLRNGIAHGFISVDIDTLKRINHKLPIIKELSKSFLADWEERGTAQEQST